LQDLEELYKKRWEIETHFDRLKNVFEVERFSSRTVVGIEQDFYGIVLLGTLAGLVAKEEDEERKNRNQQLNSKIRVQGEPVSVLRGAGGSAGGTAAGQK